MIPLPYNHQVVGTCSLCGGPVVLPVIWHGVFPPVPTCMECGATKKQSHGATIEMERSRGYRRGRRDWRLCND